MRPFELSRDFQVERSTISHAIRGLEKKGWLKRVIHPTDARGYMLSLSPSGKKKAMTLVKIFDQAQESLEENFGTRKLREAVDSINALRKCYRDHRLRNSGT